MFKVSKAFVVSLAEQVGVAAAGAFVAVLSASNGSVDRAALVAGVAAAVRAAYGVVTRTFGNPDVPSVK